MIELQIPSPVPIPGIKLGLANIITLFAVFEIGNVDAFLILLSRILLGGLFSGNPTAILYSLAGGILCFLVTILFKKIVTKKQIWVASVFGALAHNIGQMTVALIVTRTAALLGYLPVLMVSAVITGLFTGVAATVISKKAASAVRM